MEKNHYIHYTAADLLNDGIFPGFDATPYGAK